MTKTFTYRSPRDGWFWLTTSTITLAFVTYLTDQALTVGRLNWKILIPIVIFGLISIVPLLALFARLKLSRADCLRTITVNQTARTLKINEVDNSLEFSYQDVAEVVIHQSWSAAPLLSDLGYIKFILTDGRSFIIPRLTATPDDMRSLIDTKKCRTVTRLINMF